MIRLLDISQTDIRDIFARSSPMEDVAAPVAAIIAAVRAEGDAALARYGAQFDGVAPSPLQVTTQELEEAMEQVESRLLSVLKRAAANIRTFHQNQVRSSFLTSTGPGVILGQKVMPIEKVGLYVPGGTARYPSTVLMDAIPAKLAGCPDLVMVTPPGKDGKIPAPILAAARVAGVDRIFKVGGAQAIAALAYGTQSIPAVDKIVGPGNAFVAEAKKQVFGKVAIDMVAGPSEILIVSDGHSDPRYLAADLLSQAEHDKNASAVLVTDSLPLAKAVQAELERQIPALDRAEIARTSIDRNGKIIVARNLDEALDIANDIAPEHLELCVDSPFDYLDRVRHAGSVFLGRSCPEALGDYLAGPNHTLPTCGAARFSSPLSVDDFVKKTQFTYYTPQAFRGAAEDVDFFARQEGLTGHGKSAMIRLEANEL